MEGWETSGLTPSRIRNAKVVCVGKGKPMQNGAMNPASFRPIFVLSGLWCAWSTAWLRMPSMQHWRQRLFSIGMSGASPQCLGAEALVALSDQALPAGGFGVSLDFSHAFDFVSGKLVQIVLDKVLPPSLQECGGLLCSQWQSLRKWVNYGGHVACTPLQSDTGIPQGGPASPVAFMICFWPGRFGWRNSCRVR